MSSETSFRRGSAWAFLAAAMAAAFVVPWKAAVSYSEPRMAVLCMLTSAALCNTVAMLVSARTTRKAHGRLGVTLALSCVFALLTLAGNWASAEAVSRMSGALLSVIQRGEVILVALMGALLLGERVPRSFWIGATVAAGGILLLEQPSDLEGAPDSLGVVYALLCTLAFGSMVVLGRQYVGRIWLLPFNALRLWLSVGLWFVVERRVPTAGDLPAGLVLNAALAGVFGPFLSRLSALQSAHHVHAYITALTALTSPVMALFLAWAFLGNLPTAAEMAGGGLMLAGVAIPVGAQAWRARSQESRV